MNNNKKLGLVLGSGAARGLAHIGILKVLHDAKIPIDIISGTSIGALIGALYAAGIHPNELIKRAISLNWISILNLLDPTINKSGLIRGEKIERFISTLIGNIRFEDLKIPFACQCTDINSGKIISFKKGNLVEAIRASISVPGIMIPVEYNGNQLVDGGLIDPVPVKEAQILGASHVIAVDVTTDVQKYTSYQEKKKNGIFSNFFSKKIHIPNTYQIILKSIYIMESEIARHNLAANSPDILIKPQIDQFRLFEFYKTKEIIETGIKAAKDNLNNIRNLISQENVK